jgi:uncharacterized LabA/DUF88 family protein
VGKNVAVFVDVANIFYAAKAAGVDIDYVTLLKASSAGRDLVRAYAYTGLDPDNENQRNFHDFLRRHGYRVVSKDIRKYGDGKVKANLDIELVVDMMKTARNLDVAIVVSGDGDFAPAIRAVQEMGVRVEVVSFRGNTSSDLMDVADQFTDITQIAKVEKGSSRSGRRVAGDESDLSMTEVPEKQSEGAAERRGRGRSRRTGEAVAATNRRRSRAAAPGEPALVVLPGEKLSRAAPSSEAVAEDEAMAVDGVGDVEPLESSEAAAAGAEDLAGDDGARRRRRRRGGRGRGRGRGREDGYTDVDAPAGPRPVAGEDDDEELDLAPPRPRPASAFGSVWDSQIGIPAASRGGSQTGGQTDEDEEDLEEPAIPEYLLAERRRQGAQGGRGGRGGRGRGGAYAAALERERFGGGRGSVSRYTEPPRGRDSGGFRREPSPMRGGGRPAPAPRGSSQEPWSEVPPEIEAMLRAQLGTTRGAPGAGRGQTREPAQELPEERPAAAAVAAEAAPVSSPSRSRSRAASPRARGRGASAPAEATGGAAATTTAAEGPEASGSATVTPPSRRRTTTGSTRASKAVTAEPTSEPTQATTAASGTAEPTAEKPKRTTRARKTTATAEAAGESENGEKTPATPRRRSTRKKTEPAG